MKLIAIIISIFLWICLIFFLRLQIKVNYVYEKLESNLELFIQTLLFKTTVRLKITDDLTKKGFNRIFNNLLLDITQNKKEDRVKRKSKRYVKVKRMSGEKLREIISFWPGFLWLTEKFAALKKSFYKKIYLDFLEIKVELGLDEAAQTGIMVGSIWAYLGKLTARLYRIVKVRTANIKLDVKPNFNQKKLLCFVSCILSLKISHIIFTAYKMLRIILKYRRIRSYGRASD